MDKAREAIREVIRKDISRGQEAWEMLMSGYNGNESWYMADYEGDYVGKEVGDAVIVKRNEGEYWLVKDGHVFNGVYEVIDKDGETLFASDEWSDALGYSEEHEDAWAILHNGRTEWW